MPASCRPFAYSVVVVVSALACACTTPTSTIRLPECVDRIDVAGQHARGARTTIILDHSYDLPFSRTELVVEGRDGRVREQLIVNSVPDVWRLVGGGIVALLGGALVTRYGFAVSGGEDAIRSPWFWALPAGAILGAVGGTLMLTGWHPPSDTVVDYPCPEGEHG